MTEEEQIAYAMQMSMAENEGGEGGSEEKMDVDDKDQDYSEVMNDPEFLQSVLQVNVIPIAQWSRLGLRIIVVSIFINSIISLPLLELAWSGSRL